MKSSSQLDLSILDSIVSQWIRARQRKFELSDSELQISANPKCFQIPSKAQNEKKKEYQKKFQERESWHPENLELRLKFQRKKLPFIILFAIACQSWWYPENLRAAVQYLILEEERIRFNYQHPELEIVLKSKANCILYLQDQVWRRQSWRYLFGTIFTEKWSVKKVQKYFDSETQEEKKVLRTVNFSIWEILPKYFILQKPKPRRIQRHRGYRDHGTLTDESTSVRRTEFRKDFLPKQEEEMIERRKKNFSDSIKLLFGWIQ